MMVFAVKRPPRLLAELKTFRGLPGAVASKYGKSTLPTRFTPQLPVVPSTVPRRSSSFSKRRPTALDSFICSRRSNPPVEPATSRRSISSMTSVAPRSAQEKEIALIGRSRPMGYEASPLPRNRSSGPSVSMSATANTPKRCPAVSAVVILRLTNRSSDWSKLATYFCSTFLFAREFPLEYAI